MRQQIIAQAAEAILIRHGDSIIKRRIKKGYRIPELDEKLRKLRTRSESKLLEKSSKLISVPRLIRVDEKSKEIEMEFIQGTKLADMTLTPEIMEKVGREVAILHDNNIIHGDLTTSNMILVESGNLNHSETNKSKNNIKDATIKPRKEDLTINNEIKLIKNEKIFIIDFGLGFISTRLEDKAVDIHLLKQALEAKHFENHKEMFEAFLEGYKSKDKEKILEQLKKVESRGRYKHE